MFCVCDSDWEQLIRLRLIHLSLSDNGRRSCCRTLACVCVCVSSSSILSMRKDEINEVQFQLRSGVGLDHLLCRWSVCEFCSGSVWIFPGLRVWMKSERTSHTVDWLTWGPRGRFYMETTASVRWQDGGLAVTLFIIWKKNKPVHLITNLASSSCGLVCTLLLWCSYQWRTHDQH